MKQILFSLFLLLFVWKKCISQFENKHPENFSGLLTRLELLDGAIEIETSLGEKRTFQAGEILLMEDTEGKGHKTRNLQPIKRKSIFITLP